MLVVDSCVLIDIADGDPLFGHASARCLAAHLNEGLVISPVSYVELAPVFDGSTRRLDEFLDGAGVRRDQLFELSDRAMAFAAWSRHISAKRRGKASRRPIADVLIGALAQRLGGVITRNGPDFVSLFPGIRVVDPTHGRPPKRRKRTEGRV
jgi:predicted nucleic acid-binding protein